jgi:predicted Na+-dependent transporter
VSAQGLFTALFNAAIAVAIIATVCSLGMAFTVAEVVAPLRRWAFVTVMVGVNCALIPAVAWSVFKAFGLNDAYVAGATLAAIGAAGSSGLKAAQFAKRADLALAVSLVVVLQLANLVAVPLWAGAVVSAPRSAAGRSSKTFCCSCLSRSQPD